MAGAVNLAALRSAELHKKPWRWAQYEQAFLQPDELAQAYPSAGLKHHTQAGFARVHGTVALTTWDNNEDSRTLIELGAREPCDPAGLDRRWLEVVTDLLSQDYAETLSDLVKLDLGDLKMRAFFQVFSEQYSCRPHVDQARERVVHLLYLDGTDEQNTGGVFQVLSSADPKDVVAEVLPLPNQAIVQVRSDNAWHAVSPDSAGQKSRRRMLHVNWEEG